MDYLREPAAIYAKSFATIRAEADLASLPAAAHGLAMRVIHACGMVDAAGDLRVSEALPRAVISALAQDAPIFADCEMVRSGIIARNLPAATEILCTLNDPRTADIAAAKATTRSAAAVDLWLPRLAGSVVVIGNAPTTLFALLEALDSGAPKPAAIIAMPVGFVGAAESKTELAANPRGVPFATLLGRRGGSAMAAAALNALAIEARA